MTREDRALLDLVRGALQGENPADPDLDAAGWQGLLRQAESHKLLPLVVDAAIRLPSLYRASQGAEAPFTVKELRTRALEHVNIQVNFHGFQSGILTEDTYEPINNQAIDLFLIWR